MQELTLLIGFDFVRALLVRALDLDDSAVQRITVFADCRTLQAPDLSPGRSSY
jgi:hypothetical protein